MSLFLFPRLIDLINFDKKKCPDTFGQYVQEHRVHVSQLQFDGESPIAMCGRFIRFIGLLSIYVRRVWRQQVRSVRFTTDPGQQSEFHFKKSRPAYPPGAVHSSRKRERPTVTLHRLFGKFKELPAQFWQIFHLCSSDHKKWFRMAGEKKKKRRKGKKTRAQPRLGTW